MVFLSQKLNGIMIFTDYRKVLAFIFSGMGNTVFFLSQRVDGNIIFTDYWKVIVLNFSVMGNPVFFWVKKLMERRHLLVTEKFLFWTYRWWEIRPFFSQKGDGKMIITFFFFNFPWYSRTWEIWFFAQCNADHHVLRFSSLLIWTIKFWANFF